MQSVRHSLKTSIRCNVRRGICVQAQLNASNQGRIAAQTAAPDVLPLVVDRRAALLTSLAILAAPQMAQAAVPAPPPGFRRHIDKLDGYAFNYPEDWSQVTTSGNDVFYRNPRNLDENLFVDVSSPSSSKFKTVEDCGTPQEAAARYLKQYLAEFMSTRLGVRREAEVVSAVSRTAPDGKLYYDFVVAVRSYASRQQLAITQEERVQELEWDRRLITTLGVANKRLYELRIQAGANVDQSMVSAIQQSFRCKDLDL